MKYSVPETVGAHCRRSYEIMVCEVSASIFNDLILAAGLYGKKKITITKVHT